jgi:hypothetical protein
MTREDIIRMAREAGCPVAGIGPMTFDDKQLVSMLERFANLVAQAESEACAKVCESIDMEAFGVLPVRTVMITNHCADAIRAKS